MYNSRWNSKSYSLSSGGGGGNNGSGSPRPCLAAGMPELWEDESGVKPGCLPVKEVAR